MANQSVRSSSAWQAANSPTFSGYQYGYRNAIKRNLYSSPNCIRCRNGIW